MLYIFNIQSIIDVITNSSSELFIFKNVDTRKELIELLNKIYPDWRNEYAEPVQINKLDEYAFDDYIYYVIAFDYHMFDYNNYNQNKKNSMFATLAEKYEMDRDEFFQNYYKFDPNSEEWENRNLQISDKGYAKIRSTISNSKYALFSHSDNPNFDYQDILSKFADRYHLG